MGAEERRTEHVPCAATWQSERRPCRPAARCGLGYASHFHLCPASAGHFLLLGIAEAIGAPGINSIHRSFSPRGGWLLALEDTAGVDVIAALGLARNPKILFGLFLPPPPPQQQLLSGPLQLT